MFKLCAFDVDGTLFTSKKMISEQTKEAISKAVSQGASITIASGRPTQGLKRVISMLQIPLSSVYMVGYNGAIATRAEDDKTLFSRPMDRNLTNQLFEYCKRFDVSAYVSTNQTMYASKADGFNIEYESSGNNLSITVMDNMNLIEEDIHKILFSGHPQEINRMLDDARIHFSSLCELSISAPFYLECNSKGINKADALEAVCETMGIERKDVIAFGDAGNDLEMIEFAGYGVAMGNATDAVKEIANEITSSNDDEGIAHVLNRYYF